MTQILTLEELKQRSLDEILNEIIEQDMTLIVRLPNGEEILIESRSQLRPLPVLSGYIPAGWKVALYR